MKKLNFISKKFLRPLNKTIYAKKYRLNPFGWSQKFVFELTKTFFLLIYSVFLFYFKVQGLVTRVMEGTRERVVMAKIRVMGKILGRAMKEVIQVQATKAEIRERAIVARDLDRVQMKRDHHQ